MRKRNRLFQRDLLAFTSVTMVAIAGASCGVDQSITNRSGSPVTITFVTESPEGITHARYSVELALIDPNGRAETFKVDVPIHATSEDAALLVSVTLQDRNVPSTIRASTNRSVQLPGSPANRAKFLYDLILPAGFQLQSFTIHRIGGGTDGPLKACVDQDA